MKLTSIWPIAGLVVLLLAGCTPGTPTPTPTASPTSSPSATPTPTPTPTTESEADDAALASRVVIFSGLLAAVDAGESSIGLLDMFEPVASIDATIAEISGWFGFEPTSEFIPMDPSGDGVDYTSYRWDGFELMDWDRPASRVPAMPEFIVSATSADIRGVRLESIDGVAVGDDIGALEAANPDSYRQTNQFGVEEALVRINVMEPVEGRYLPVSFAVQLRGQVPGIVEQIISPSPDIQI